MMTNQRLKVSQIQRLALRMVALCTVLAMGGLAVASEVARAAEPMPQDGPAYRVSEFEVGYVLDHPQHPAVSELAPVIVHLTQTSRGFVAPREGSMVVSRTLGDLMTPGPTETYYASAVQRILETILAYYNEQDYMGVFVAPDPRDISQTGEDRRPETRTALRILITTGIVTELRTLASGERVEREEILEEERVNHPYHEKFIERSPIRVYDPNEVYVDTGEPVERRDLLNKWTLDRFVYHQSRHPGRRLDVSVGPAIDPGTIALDYQVTENKPLTLYTQISNTGTRSTDYMRYRFGLFHTQLTENDDVFSLDYSTAKFDEAHAVFGSYERPFENDRYRWRVYGSYSEYKADQLGFFDSDFEGRSYGGGAELIANFYQDQELFFDVYGGFRYADYRVENILIDEGEEDFFIPYIGLRMEQETEWYNRNGFVVLEFQPFSADEDEVVRLGRTLPDDNWEVLRWNLTQSVYLEPLFDRAAWEDPTTPGSSTLAHELALSFRGQYAFGNRLIPQEQGVAGGLYSVRGYPQSVVAGDTLLLGSVEYRYHVPRAFGIESEPRELFGEPFRAAPQYVYGTPDWDLVLKGFFDIGRTEINDALSFEDDETLIGAGVGLDFIYRRNLTVRVDWGFVLKGLDTANVDDGSNRVHFVVTFLF